MTEQILSDEPEHKLNLRHLRFGDYQDIKAIMNRVYPTVGGAISESKYRTQLAAFPDGQICIEDHGVVVAAAFSVIVDYDKFNLRILRKMFSWKNWFIQRKRNVWSIKNK